MVYFRSCTVIFLLQSPTRGAKDLVLVSAHFREGEAYLISFSIVVACLEVLFTGVGSRSRVAGFIRLFLPISKRSIPTLLSQSRASSSRAIPNRSASSPIGALLSFCPIYIRETSS